MEKNVRSYAVHSVQRALAIMKVLAHTKCLSVSEIARAIGAPKATTFVIIKTLEAENIVFRLENGSYQLGSGLYDILFGSKFLDILRHVAEPFLEELSAETKMTVHMAVREGRESVYIAKIDGPGFVHFNTFIGQRHLLYLTAIGKAMLMGMDDDEICKLFPMKSFPRKTPKTIRGLHHLLEEIKEARKRGYAIEDEEGELGVRCIGAPIMDVRGRTVGAISITALKEHLPSEVYHDVGSQVVNTARKVAYSISIQNSNQEDLK